MSPESAAQHAFLAAQQQFSFQTDPNPDYGHLDIVAPL